MQIAFRTWGADWYTKRALWRWKPNQNLPNGGIQFLCPQCAGTVDTTAKTRIARATNSHGPFLSIEDEYCCLGLASVSLALLDSFQRIPYGTLAWKQSYGRRNIIEKSNAMLKIQRHAQRQRRIGCRVVQGIRSRR